MKRAKFWLKFHYGGFLASLGFMTSNAGLVQYGQRKQLETLLETGWENTDD